MLLSIDDTRSPKYSQGNDYWQGYTTSTFPYSSSYRYRNVGIVCAFIGFNFFLIYGELKACTPYQMG